MHRNLVIITCDSCGPGSARPTPPRPADVAIAGILAMLAGSGDVVGYWEDLLDGVDAITGIPRYPWVSRLCFDADPDGAASCPACPLTRCAMACRPAQSPRSIPCIS